MVIIRLFIICVEYFVLEVLKLFNKKLYWFCFNVAKEK